MSKQVENLLNQVSDLSHKYLNINNRILSDVYAISKKYEKIAEITGENFNIFRVLGVSTNEVRTHSAFIAELLNPEGCHDMGDVFLSLFISKLIEQKAELKFDKNELQIVENFDCPNSVINIEHSYNYTYEDGEERGRIDILVKDNKGKVIIIENKIYAGDQEEQLLGYYRYGSYHYKNNSLLFYLTLYGTEPSDWSTGVNEQKNDNENKKQHEDIRYHIVSYKEFILKWLDECRQKAVNHTLLRETITQYINLIKYLTNQTINSIMEKEIASIIANEKNLKSAFLILKSMPEVRNTIIEDFNIHLEEKIAKELGLKTKGKLTKESYSKIWFFKPNWKSHICLSFEKEDFDSFWVGIGKGPQKHEYLEEEKEYEIINDKLEKDFNNIHRDNYYAFFWYFDNFLAPCNWRNNEDIWLAILQKDDKLLEKFENLLHKLSDVLDDVYNI